MSTQPSIIGIIGLGYVGLPLAVEFGKKYQVIGFDINENRIAELSNGIDSTSEIDTNDLEKILSLKSNNKIGLVLTTSEEKLKFCNVFIITVPTPITHFNSPDLSLLINASERIGRIIKKNDIVIYESTTYPGCTEEDCVPVIEKISGLKYNSDFFVGYSPERINPGDKINTLTTIRKITSGSTTKTADFIDQLYSSIIEAGTFKAPSIKVAEAAKIIENAQRDVNISFINELALIFDRMGIDTHDVLDAASTKWNFLKFQPGLVGGHCLSVDPYYLACKAESLGYTPKVILSGRHVNNSMASFITNKVLKLMVKKHHHISGSNVLILGITFKEDCPDIRNTKVADIYNEFCEFDTLVDVFDPHASPSEVKEQLGINLIPTIDPNKKYEAILLAVAHNDFKKINFEKYYKQGTVIFDTKAIINREWVDARL